MQIKEAANERSRWFIDSVRSPGAVCVGDFSNTQQKIMSLVSVMLVPLFTFPTSPC